MSKETINYLKHILDECLYLKEIVENNLTKDQFLNNKTLQRAAVRSLEIIGEATKKIPVEFKNDNRGIEWKSMAGMRDRLIHNYMEVNYLLIWDVIKNKIPKLYQQINDLINKEE